MEKNTSYQTLTLHGSAKEVGSKHGETLRNEINALYDERIKLITDTTGSKLSLVEQISSGIWESTKSILPEIILEIESTAKAANLKPWQLIVAGGFSDVLDLCNQHNNVQSKANECSLGISSLSDNSPVLIGTWDTHATAKNSLVLIDRKIGSGPRTISLSTVGWPMQQGLNELGLSFAITNLGSTSSFNGTTYIAALIAISSCESSMAASIKAQNTPLCSARYFQFLDQHGKSVGVETNGKVFSTKKNAKSHTNHFVYDDMLKLEGRPNIVLESQRRLENLQNLLGSNFNEAELIFEAIKSFNNKDFPIEKKGTHWEDRTCATFVISPQQGKMWFTPGPPSQEEISCVSLN